MYREVKQGSGVGDLGRFAEPAVLVMMSLAGGAKHGYAITADVGAVYRAQARAGHALRGHRTARGSEA